MNTGYVKIVYNVGNVAETDLQMLICSSYIVIRRIELCGAKYVQNIRLHREKIQVFIFDLHKYRRNILASNNLNLSE